MTTPETPEAPSDDLSGGSEPPAPIVRRANETLGDARSRVLYRHTATVVVVAVLLCLIYELYRIIRVLTKIPVLVNTSTVALASVLVVAVTVLTIALLRSTFAPADGPTKGSELGANALLTTPSIEALKAIKDAVVLIIKGPSKD